MNILNWFDIFGIDHIFTKSTKDTLPNTTLSNTTLSINTISTDDSTLSDSFEKLFADINNIDCYIKQTARNTVIYDGDLETSKILLIGEAPGQEEDRQGKPFVGQSGILLNNMLQAINLKRSDVIISNIVFWRPPANRTPSSDEISLCLPYVHRLINLIKPKAILLLGSVAVHSILNTNAPITKCRGTIKKFQNINTVATYHPAYLLRSVTQKQLAFKDLILFSRLLRKS